MVLTSEQIRYAEQKSVDLGMNWLRLMENAGSAAAREIRDNYSLEGKKVVIVCGKGNNGGDGYVIARKLLEDNAHVRVVAVGTPATQSSREMASKALSLGIRPVDFENYETVCCQYLSDADLIIDALFGTGLKGSLNGLYSAAISAINYANAPVVSVDIPSGMDCDSGKLDISGEMFVKADLTVTFAAYKPCHLLYPSGEHCGKIVLASIGMPDEAFYGINPILTVVTEKYAAGALPKRTVNWHKGLSGTAALFVGSKGYAGAALLSSRAAVASGAGIVNVILPDSIYPIVSGSLPEAVCTVLDYENSNNFFLKSTEKAINLLNSSTVGLVGCGLGRSFFTEYTVREIMKSCHIPLVIDADGINILSDCIDLIKNYSGKIVMTPHPKEASKLLGCSVEKIQNDRIGSAKKLSEITGAVTVLKGAKTIISVPDGNSFVVTDGNPGMATAGTGDMLAGMITAFIAQGLSVTDASMCGVKIHAMSGDAALESSSVLSLTPSNMIDALPAVFTKLYCLE